MSFNVDKCMIVSITLKRSPYIYILIMANKLSVLNDSKLSFNQHVDNVCKKANCALGFVRRNFRSCSRKIKEDL